MNAPLALLLCCVVGSAVGYYAQPNAPYNIGPNDPFAVDVNPNFLEQPSQRLFWGSGQGSNQVGGTGLWNHLTNKFPFLGNMFGRMELPTQYGPPSVNNYDYQQYSAPGYQSYNLYHQAQPQFNQAQPQFNHLQPQFNQVPPQYPQQFSRQYPRNFATGRDVAITDDAVIVTPPHVPIGPPAPVPAPAEPAEGGYQYNKPQYRLELPHK
ncbi:uncharacterized protein LOC134789504 [Cydia splendana]|uniref:uncharacterized protein LOC134789504 n=1 Tax=Cydia splendana TaxID=1100963 RepID=UPI00213E43F9